MKIIIVMLSSLWILGIQAFAEAPKINPVADSKAPMIRFDIENQSTQNYFCRDITLSNADYYFKGGNEYLFSLDAKLTSKYIDKNSKVSFLQNPNDELNDLLTEGRELQVSFDKNKVTHDCEPKDSRMNNVYVLDDQTQCGKGVVLKALIFDGINLQLSHASAVESNFEKDAKFFKLNSRNSIVIQNKRRITIADIKGALLSQSRDLARLETDEVLLAAFALKDSYITLATYSTEKGIVLKVYNATDAGYNLVSSKVLSEFALIVSPYKDMGITNREEIEKFYKGQLENISENISIYSNHIASRSIFEITIMARMPSAEVIVTNIIGNKVFRKLRPLEISENLEVTGARIAIDLSSEIEFKQKADIPMEEMFALVNKNVLLREGQLFNQINFKDYQLTAAEKKILISNKTSKKSVDGFCSIKSIFSDALISSGQFDINQMYDGRPVLVTAIREKKSYDEILKIISMGGNVNLADKSKMGPLYYAVRLRNLNIVKLLLENGADVNAKVGSQSLFSYYLENMLIDFSVLNLDEKKPTAANIHEMLKAFKKYNYSLRVDEFLPKLRKVINEMQDPSDRQLILNALELK